MSRIHIRFNIALANENLKELDKAHDEYNSLLNEIMHPVRFFTLHNLVRKKIEY